MPVISKDEVVKNEVKENVETPLIAFPRNLESELANMMAVLPEEELNEQVDSGKIIVEINRRVEPEEEKEKEEKNPILPEQEDSKVPNTKEDPEGSESGKANLTDGILDKEEKYLKEKIKPGTYVDKDDVRAVSAKYQKTISDIEKNDDLSQAQKNVKIAEAGAVWKNEMDSLIAKAEPYNLGEIRKKQFEAGLKGKALEYYHKDDNGDLIQTTVSRDTTKQYVHDLINTHKERVGEAEKAAKTQESKMTSNAATFVRGDAESMSHGTMYMTANVLIWLAEKAMAQGHKWSAEFEEFLAKQKIKIEDKDPNKEQPEEEEVKDTQDVEETELSEEQAEDNGISTQQEEQAEKSAEEPTDEKEVGEPSQPTQDEPVQTEEKAVQNDEMSEVLGSMDNKETGEAEKVTEEKEVIGKTEEVEETVEIDNEDYSLLEEAEEVLVKTSDEELLADGDGGLEKTSAPSPTASAKETGKSLVNESNVLENVDELTM